MNVLVLALRGGAHADALVRRALVEDRAHGVAHTILRAERALAHQVLGHLDTSSAVVIEVSAVEGGDGGIDHRNEGNDYRWKRGKN